MAASHGFFDLKICLLALLTTVGFQVISNFANDYGDGVKGTDDKDRIGPERTIQSGAITPEQMLKAMGARIKVKGREVTVHQLTKPLAAIDFVVPGDFSAHHRSRLHGVGLRQRERG